MCEGNLKHTAVNKKYDTGVGGLTAAPVLLVVPRALKVRPRVTLPVLLRRGDLPSRINSGAIFAAEIKERDAVGVRERSLRRECSLMRVCKPRWRRG